MSFRLGCRFCRPPFVNRDERAGRVPAPARRRTDMKQYLLAVHMVEGEPVPSETQMQQAYKAVDAFNADLQSAGAWVFAGGLHPPATATVVRAQGGQVVTTDGPFAETKEQLGGFWIIKVADLDAALDWAAKGSAACGARSPGRRPTPGAGSSPPPATRPWIACGGNRRATAARHRPPCCTPTQTHRRWDQCAMTACG